VSTVWWGKFQGAGGERGREEVRVYKVWTVGMRYMESLAIVLRAPRAGYIGGICILVDIVSVVPRLDILEVLATWGTEVCRGAESALGNT